MVRLSRTRIKRANTTSAYPGFCSAKQLRVLLLPPGWDASPSQGYPQRYVAGTHFIRLGGERKCAFSKGWGDWSLRLVPGTKQARVHYPF